MKNKKILITGACGFIGSHLTEYLLENDYEIVAFDRYNINNHYGWLDNSKYRNDNSPLDINTINFSLNKYSKNYLNHLFNANEILASMLLTLHNINFSLVRIDIHQQISQKNLQLFQVQCVLYFCIFLQIHIWFWKKVAFLLPLL